MSTKLKYKLIGASIGDEYYNEQFKKEDHSTALEYIRNSHFLCLLSEREAMGAVVFEALSNGVFVVLSKEIGAKRIVEKHGSELELPKGVLHYNFVGCVVDVDLLDPSSLNEFILSKADEISKNRETRSAVVRDYLV